MTIECYYHQCAHHGANDTPPEEGPFCFESECLATEPQIIRWANERKLEKMGYNLEELDRDNPYNQWMHEA